MSLLNSLAGTESGGRFDAVNNEVGSSGRSGHFGRLQFGRDRLDDAIRAGVLPKGITPQQFMKSPDLQAKTERWHKADMLRQADRLGLSRFVGKTVGGIPITMDAILAMGHLGGMGGAKKFLESGGRHNPSDSFGTSLADYARKHGGASAWGSDYDHGDTSPPSPQSVGQPPQASTMNRLAMAQQFAPQQNQLDAAAFQSQRPQNALMGFGQGQNPFVR